MKPSIDLASGETTSLKGSAPKLIALEESPFVKPVESLSTDLASGDNGDESSSKTLLSGVTEGSRSGVAEVTSVRKLNPDGSPNCLFFRLLFKAG